MLLMSSARALLPFTFYHRNTVLENPTTTTFAVGNLGDETPEANIA